MPEMIQPLFHGDIDPLIIKYLDPESRCNLRAVSHAARVAVDECATLGKFTTNGREISFVNDLIKPNRPNMQRLLLEVTFDYQLDKLVDKLCSAKWPLLTRFNLTMYEHEYDMIDVNFDFKSLANSTFSKLKNLTIMGIDGLLTKEATGYYGLLTLKNLPALGEAHFSATLERLILSGLKIDRSEFLWLIRASLPELHTLALDSLDTAYAKNHSGEPAFLYSYLEQADKWPKLQTLFFMGCKFTVEAMKRMVENPHWPQLDTFGFIYNQFCGDRHPNYHETVDDLPLTTEFCKKLRVLIITGSWMLGGKLSSRLSSYDWPNLEVLDISHLSEEQADWAALLQNLQAPKLRALNFGRRYANDDAGKFDKSYEIITERWGREITEHGSYKDWFNDDFCLII